MSHRKSFQRVDTFEGELGSLENRVIDPIVKREAQEGAVLVYALGTISRGIS